MKKKNATPRSRALIECLFSGNYCFNDKPSPTGKNSFLKNGNCNYKKHCLYKSTNKEICMIIRKEDLTEYALGLGCWETLLEMAGLNPSENSDAALEILKVQKAEVNEALPRG
jgi:hypothetical protein